MSENSKSNGTPGGLPTRAKKDAEQLRDVVRSKYGQVARQAVAETRVESESTGAFQASGSVSQCCTRDTCCDPITTNLYSDVETCGLPAEAVLASRGCGNPAALAALAKGEFVLDLGSGGGIDVLLSAQRAGPTGKAYGLDMTDEMLALARENQAKAGVTNVEFLKGEIENIPLPDSSVDVIISNCVINLSFDKPRVLAESFRVLKPGGRLAVSDIVVRGPVDARIRESVELWIGCVAGALAEEQYRSYLTDAGFCHIEIEPTRIYDLADAQELLSSLGDNADEIIQMAAGKFISAFVRAERPLNGVT